MLHDSTKQSATLRKAVIQKKFYRRDRDKSSPSRRDRSRSPSKRSGHSRGNSGGNNLKRKHSNDGGSSKDPRGSSAKKPRTGSKAGSSKKKGTSPFSFHGFYSFLSTEALEKVQAEGLCIDDISNVDHKPIGGRLQFYYDNWTKIDCSEWVLSVVRDGYKMPLQSVPIQQKIPANPKATGSAHTVLVKEAQDLLAKKAVFEVEPCEGEYISSYFAVPKPRKTDEFRPILNLKYFNRNVKKYSFSLEGLAAVREWIKPGYFCVSLDIRDAFLHISVNKRFRKYLRFHWLDQLLEWAVIPFGLTCSPRVLTKVIKPILAFIRRIWGILISIYFDDILIQSRSISECILHCHIVIIVFMCLGWSFKWTKCDLVPKKQFTYLGFNFDTDQMIIICPIEKVTKLRQTCIKIFSAKNISVHSLEKILGTMESLRPAVPYAALHYRSLQHQLLVAKVGQRVPNKIVFLSQESLKELFWWISPSGFTVLCSAPIREPDPTLDIWSDANLNMGGAHCSRGKFFQREWSQQESQLHINLLEIRAAREGLSLARPGDCVRIHIDSRTAASYIRKQGGTKSFSLNLEACLLWRKAKSRNITLLTPHWLSTKDNVMADFLSRHHLNQWEFQLSVDVFNLVLDHFHVSPTMDIFASRETNQLPRYMSWFPDQLAVARDAMLHPWDPISYAFPPIPLILKTLQKIEKEKIKVIMILPQWPTALWWPLVQSLMLCPLLPLPNYKSILTMVDRSRDLPNLNPLIAVLLQAKT